MDSSKFKMNYYVPALCLLFLILLLPIGDFGFYHCVILLVGLVLFLGALLLLWQMEINDHEITIKYLIPLGRNRTFRWNEISDIEIISQKYHGKIFYELMIVPSKGNKIKFFRLGVLGYRALCDLLIKIYREKTG